MKFISTQQNLHQGLSVTEKIISKNFTLPILQNTLFCCNKNNGVVTLSSTDLEMGVEIHIPARIEEEGSVTVPTKLVSDFVKNLPTHNITFQETNKKISVCCGNYQSNIKGEDSAEFPLIPNPKEKAQFNVASNDFLRGISLVINSASLLGLKPEISGVYIQFKDNEVCFAATDSFRLSEKIIKSANKNTYTGALIVPRKVCETMLRIFQDFAGLLTVQADNNQIIVKNNPEDNFMPKIRFVGKIIDGEYPNYEQIIPKEFSKSVEVARVDFIQRIKTAGLFSNKVSEVTLCLNERGQELSVIANDQERGDHLSIIPCKIKGNEEKISFNFQYLLDGLQNMNSPIVLMRLNEATTPVLIQPKEDEGFRYLIMPIRI